MSGGNGAGGAARDEYERRVAARLRRLKAEGATDDELCAALDASPAHEQAWAIGAEGEERVAAVLDAWADMCGFGVLHDLRIPGRRANIDHVVVGLGGVTVIDTKAWNGDVRVTGTTIRVGSWSHKRQLTAIAGQAALVREALLARGIDVPVSAGLCLANRNLGRGRDLPEVDTVRIGTPEAMAAWASTGSACSHERAWEAHAALVEHFHPRAVTAVGELPQPSGAAPPAPRHVPPDRAQPTTPRPAWWRRELRHWRRAPRTVRAAVVAVATLATAGSMLGGSSRPPARAAGERLDATAVLAMRPALRTRAVAAAGGPVRGPRLQLTATRAHVRFRRGACRIHLSLNRTTARTAADAVLVTGGRC